MVLFFHNSSLNAELGKTRKDVLDLQDKINSMKDVETLHKTIQDKKTAITAKLDAVKKVTDSQVTFIRHIDEMQKIIPSGIWIEKIGFTGSSSNFECKASSYYEISDFYKRLKSSGYFTVGAFPSISEAAPEGGVSVYKFKINSNLKDLTIKTKQAGK